MKKILLLFGLLLYCWSVTNAQCVSVVAYPENGDSLLVPDWTKNDTMLWNPDGHDFYDQVLGIHDLPEADCDLILQVKKQCAPAACRLYLDLNQDGAQETVVASSNFDALPAGMIHWKNVYQFNGPLVAFDKRPVPSEQKYKFALAVDTLNAITTTRIVWKSGNTTVTPKLPEGRHRIVWQVDGQFRTMFFEVRDTRPPTVTCNGFSGYDLKRPIFGEFLKIYYIDMLQYAEDNLTPSWMLDLAIAKKTNDIPSFPIGSNNQSVKKIFIDSSEIGIQNLELWARDLHGNSEHCEMYLDITHEPFESTDTIYLKDIFDNPFTDLNVDFKYHSTSSNKAYFVSGYQSSKGYFRVLWNSPNSELKPEHKKDYLQNVTFQDYLALINHVNGFQPFCNPYQLIAADIDRSGIVDADDVEALRLLLTGAYTELPDNDSWRFVYKQQVFTDTLNPFQDSLIESILVTPQTPYPVEFIAIKIGDVDQPFPCFQSAPDERDAHLTVHVVVAPNPVTEDCTFHFFSQEPVQCQLMLTDLSGRVLSVQSLALGYGAQVLTIDNHLLPSPGIYGWKLVADNQQTQFGKIIKH